MNTSLIEHITTERLQSWGKRLVENQATPVLLLGVGHGDRSGQMRLLITQDLPDDYLKGFATFLYRSVVLGEPIPVKG